MESNKYKLAYWKLDHTCCLNSNDIKYGLIDDVDPNEPEDRDCKDINEMLDSLELVEECILKYDELLNDYEDLDSFHRHIVGQYNQLCNNDLILTIIINHQIDLSSFYEIFVKGDLDYNYYEDNYIIYSKDLINEKFFDLLKEYLCNHWKN